MHGSQEGLVCVGKRRRARNAGRTAVALAGFMVSGAFAAGPATATHTAPNAWSPSADMSVGRYNHTATRLDGPACRAVTPAAYCGKVLVTGGEGTYVSDDPLATNDTASAPSLNTTALYTPSTNTWTATANMNGRRSRHTATLLDDLACHSATTPSYCGKVLVVGGADNKYSADFGLKTVELYDPVADTWTSKAPMAFDHHMHTATLLYNANKVLVAGGFPYPHAAQVYDPATDTWQYTEKATGVSAGNQYQLAFGHARHTATELNDGTVLVVGGCVLGFLNAPACSAERYNPLNRTWTQDTPPVLSTFNHTATKLANGKVLVAGGSFVRGLSSSDGNAEETTDRAEIYTPGAAVGTWSLTGSMTTPRTRHTATLLGNGKVLVAGGKADSHDLSDPLNTSERYDGGSWGSRTTMNSRRAAHTATLLSSGQVLATGGFASGVPDPIPLNAYLTGFTPISSTEHYLP